MLHQEKKKWMRKSGNRRNEGKSEMPGDMKLNKDDSVREYRNT